MDVVLAQRIFVKICTLSRQFDHDQTAVCIIQLAIIFIYICRHILTLSIQKCVYFYVSTYNGVNFMMKYTVNAFSSLIYMYHAIT